MAWPKDTREDLDAFYGRHAIANNGQPTSAWLSSHLKNFTAPYPLTLSWDVTKTVTKLYCHNSSARISSKFSNKYLLTTAASTR